MSIISNVDEDGLYMVYNDMLGNLLIMEGGNNKF